MYVIYNSFIINLNIKNIEPKTYTTPFPYTFFNTTLKNAP